MRSLLQTLTFATLAIVAPAASQGAQGADPAIGTWKLNLAKSKYDPGPAPKSLTVTVTAAGQGVKSSSTGVDGAGNPMGVQYTAAYDGKDAPVTGSPDYETLALKRVDANTTEITRKMGRKVVQTATRVVSKAGETMTVTSKGTNVQGQTINNVAVFDRQ